MFEKIRNMGTFATPRLEKKSGSGPQAEDKKHFECGISDFELRIKKNKDQKNL